MLSTDMLVNQQATMYIQHPKECMPLPSVHLSMINPLVYRLIVTKPGVSHPNLNNPLTQHHQ